MKFITTAPDRRTLVKAIAEHTGIEPSYIGPPTFNYTVGTITIDREGSVDVPDEQAADLKAFLIAKGWMEPEPEPEQPRIQIGVPAKDLTVANVTNLIYMLYSKQYLLGKAVGTACVRIEDAVITRLQEYTPEKRTAALRKSWENRSNEQFYIVYVDGVPAGMLAFCPTEDANVGDVKGLYLLPPFQGQGFGRALMDWALEKLKALGCREAILWVLEENQPARAFYAHYGFLPDEGRQELTLGKPVTIVRYRKQIA